MLNYKMVSEMFDEWREKDIEYLYRLKGKDGEDKYKLLTKGFMFRYLFLQPEELAKFSELVLERGHWPSREETEKLIELVLADNMQGLDYTAPYEPNENEDYDSYLQRIGSSLFPKKSDQWIYDNALIIRIVYESYYCCAHCKGLCPYGNRMVGVISKQNGRLQVKRAAGTCEYFRSFRNGGGTIKTAVLPVQPKQEADVQKQVESNKQEQVEEQREGNDVVYEQGQYACDRHNYETDVLPLEALG